MPSIKLTVRLSFANGEEVVTSAESAAVSAVLSQRAVEPYSFGKATVPEQPILVSSSDFVEVG